MVRSLDSILFPLVVLIAYRSFGPHLECPNRVLYECVGVPDACTLPTAEQPIRVAEFDRFFAESVSRRPDRTRLDLLVAVDAEPAGGDLAVRETGCCSFFTFAFDTTDPGPVMCVEVPGTYVADIVARLFVIPGRDLNAVRATARRDIAAYLNVPVYADFTASWAGANNWSRCGGHGGPVIARAAIPDELIDELFLYGTSTQIATRIRDYVEAIVTIRVLAIMPAAREMPPSSIAEIGRAYIGDS